MDIAKYIGLFLLKNNFCYLHGLGNLELKRKPASYEGEALQSPEYDVILTPGGSIDDNLPNYIATHEQTSISKAANALRDWTTAVKADLAAGKEVEIPGIGHFVETNGMVRFRSNPHLKHVPPPVPILRMSKRLEEAPDFRRDSTGNMNGEESTGFSGNRMVMLAVLVVVVAVAGFIAWRFLGTPSENKPAESTEQTTAVSTPPAELAPPPVMDTLPPAASTPPAPAQAGSYVVVLNEFQNRSKADRRAAKLETIGMRVEVISKDSTNFLVTTHVNMSPSDSTHVLDSLRRMYNPKGVYIMR